MVLQVMNRGEVAREYDWSELTVRPSARLGAELRELSLPAAG